MQAVNWLEGVAASRHWVVRTARVEQPVAPLAPLKLE